MSWELFIKEHVSHAELSLLHKQYTNKILSDVLSYNVRPTGYGNGNGQKIPGGNVFLRTNKAASNPKERG